MLSFSSDRLMVTVTNHAIVRANGLTTNSFQLKQDHFPPFPLIRIEQLISSNDCNAGLDFKVELLQENLENKSKQVTKRPTLPF
jgi:hypothetical protein